jgi:hypothetical protein
MYRRCCFWSKSNNFFQKLKSHKPRTIMIIFQESGFNVKKVCINVLFTLRRLWTFAHSSPLKHVGNCSKITHRASVYFCSTTYSSQDKRCMDIMCQILESAARCISLWAVVGHQYLFVELWFGLPRSSHMFNILVPFHRTFWWVRPLSSSRERFYGIHLRSEGSALCLLVMCKFFVL